MRAVSRTIASDAEFTQFRAELWDSLSGPDPGKWSTFGMTGRALEVPYGSDSNLRPAHERSVLLSAIRGGMTNENLLANLVFFDRHPERNGRLISRSEPNFQQLSEEWRRIRDTQVRPILRGTTLSQPAPTGPSPSPGGGYGPPVLGQPVAMPRVTAFRFRSADGTMTDPTNCCKVCPIALGVGQNGTASNSMELRFTLEGHRPGMEYEITRTRRSSLWQRRAGVWASLSSAPTGTKDDLLDEIDECQSPQEEKFIFVVDTPGWRRLALPSPAQSIRTGHPGVATAVDAQDIVLRASFAEWVMARNRGEGIPFTPLALPPQRYVAARFYVLWHCTVWLTRDRADRLVLDRPRSSIALGSLSERVITTAPT